MITNELKDKNLEIFLTKLNDFGVTSETIDEVLSLEKVKNASFALNNDNGDAYEGSLLNIILRTFTPYAIKLNEMLPENIRADKQSIIKVCLLQQLSKVEMYVKQTSQWHIDKGMFYTYAKSKVGLKMGMKSILLGEKLGVTFNEEEFEAMIILDRDANDEQVRFHSSTLAQIVKNAAEMTYLTLRNK